MSILKIFKSIDFPSAWLGHLHFAYFLIQEFKPKVFVELGTHGGNSYFAFCQSVKENQTNTLCYAVDHWKGDQHTFEYEGDKIFSKVNDYNLSHYSKFSKLLRMNFDDALNEFEDASVDLLHIDGFHTYEAVKHDFESWLPKLAPGAIVLFHDTQVKERDFGVYKLWQELTKIYPNHIEFTHSYGLGVLQLNDAKCYLDFFKYDFKTKKFFKLNFEYLSQNSSLNLSVEQKDNHIKNLNVEIANIQKINSDKDNHIKNLNVEIIKLQKIYTDKEIELKNIYNSRSWRCAAYLRKIAQIFRISRHFFSKKILLRFYEIVLLEGFKGILNRRKMGLQGILNNLKNKQEKNFNYWDYQKWIKLYDDLNSEDLEIIKKKISQFKNNPKISIIMTTFNSNVFFLREAIESVRKQIYENWELCIADDCSANIEVLNLLNYYKKIDKRINIIFRKKNGHISAASNSALSISKGEWIVLLDHDDVIKVDALYWVVKEINLYPQVKMIYSDEDKLDEYGIRIDPYFKCDFNKHLFYSQNMFCHLGAFKNSLVKECNGFREGFEGSQDYDLTLRCLEKISQNQIRHIPKILYHWRKHANSTSYSILSKPYAVTNGKKALEEHFIRQNINAVIEITDFGYRPRYLMPKKEPFVSLIIPTRNLYPFFKRCFESIISKTSYKNYEIIVVDNGSDDSEILKYFSKISTYSNVKVIKDNRPFNFSQICNSAVKYVKGEYFGLINNDIEVINSDWLSEMMSFIIQPNIAAVGAKLLYPDNKIQHAGVIIGVGGVAGHSHKYYNSNDPGFFSRLNLVQNLSAVTAACLITNLKIFNEVKGFDEENLKVAFNDVDYCLKLINKNYDIIYTPFAQLYHYESATRKKNDTPLKASIHNREVNFMHLKWNESLKYDPYYSPNLTLFMEDFSYAWPPRTEKV
jgi:GT2 family glycosyltransferase